MWLLDFVESVPKTITNFLSSQYILQYIANSTLWDRDVTSKTKTHIYHAIVESTIAAETGCIKTKTTAKLNSTEMDFWRRSARISRKKQNKKYCYKTKNECNKVSFRRY